ncbi:Polygalacturonase [Fulvia fulva]|nr:Polygalacturonase [Fulvia fulva]
MESAMRMRMMRIFTRGANKLTKDFIQYQFLELVTASSSPRPQHRTMAPLSFISFCGLALSTTSIFANPLPLPEGSTDSGCTFSGSDGASKAQQSKSSCSTITPSSVEVPAGKTLDLTELNDGTKVVFQGTTTFGYKEWEGPLVSISGKKITVTGESGSLLDGDGSRWWDGEGDDGKTTPKLFEAHDSTSSKISGITIKNSPVQVFSINEVEDLTVEGVTIDNKDGDSQGAANTDAFDVGSSTGVTISGAKVYNQDDCLAINSGKDITFTGGYCSGSHGLSIGSVGIRIKTIVGGKGAVKGVTFSGIKLSGITDAGIIFEQDYKDGDNTGHPDGDVPITGLTVKDITGTVSDDARRIHILCADGTCSDWSFSGVSVIGGKKSSKCSGVPSGASC